MTVPLDTVDDMRSMDAAGALEVRDRPSAPREPEHRDEARRHGGLSPTAPLPRGGADPHSRATRNGGVPIVLSTRKMASARLNRGMLTPGHSAGGLQLCLIASKLRV